MIKTLFKYHITLYQLYKEIGTKVWCGNELLALDIPGLDASLLNHKGYLLEIEREVVEILRPEVRNWISAPWVFRKISPKGLEIVRYLDENQHLIAKKLLKG